MTRCRSLVRGAASRLLRTSPARTAVRHLDERVAWPAGTYAVLTYHRIDEPSNRPWLFPRLLSATPAAFAAQMEMVNRQYVPVDVGTLLAFHRGDTGLPPRALAVTVDDGYRDFAEHAWPILRDLGVPVTLFVASDYTSNPRSYWWDRLWAAIADAAPGTPLSSPLGALVLGQRRQREQTAIALVDRFKSMPHDDAMAQVDAICMQLPQHPARADVLSWPELRQLSDEGVTLAPHSHTHPDLTKVDAGRAHSEVALSAAALRDNVGTGVAAQVFAYPTGAHSPEVRDAARQAGIAVAFTTARGVNSSNSDPLRLRRFNVSMRAHETAIRGQIALSRVRRNM